MDDKKFKFLYRKSADDEEKYLFNTTFDMHKKSISSSVHEKSENLNNPQPKSSRERSLRSRSKAIRHVRKV